MSVQRILVVEDEASLRMGLVDGLSSEGYEVLEVADGLSGLEQARTGKFDALILDLMLPRLDGFEVLRRLRQEQNSIPILVMSARGEESDRILGFEYGADDYVVKPTPLREVSLRLRAILRRLTPAGTPERVAFGDVEVDFAAYSLVRKGHRVGLNRKEVELLRFFWKHRGEPLDRALILREVWQQPRATATRTVDTHVFRLRQKVEEDADHPRHIHTLRGVGYRFDL